MAAVADSEDYPTRQDLIRAGGLAVFSGLVGFVVTYALFVRPNLKETLLAGLDRRAAETSQPHAYKESQGAGYTFSGSYSTATSVREKRVSKFVVETPKLVALAPEATATPSATPSASPTAQALPLPGQDYHTKTSHLHIEAPPEPATAVTAPERPGEVDFGQAWQRAASGWVTFGDGLRVGGEGVVVADGQVLTTLSAYQATGGRGMLAGSPVSSHLIASDSANDLALLQLDSGAGVPVPLCPEAAAAGQLLVAGDVLNPGTFQEVRSRGPAGADLGYYGWTSSPSGGSPLINNRGELVALSLPRAGWNSLSWNVAVPSATLQAFLANRPRGGSSPPTNGVERWASCLRSHATPLTERVAPSRSNGRVVAGQAMGNYPLGLTADQLKAELGAGEVLETRGNLQRINYSGPRLVFTLADGVVVAIETDYSFYALENGWAVGARVDSNQARSQLPSTIFHRRAAFEAVCSPGVELHFDGGQISLLRVTVP